MKTYEESWEQIKKIIRYKSVLEIGGPTLLFQNNDLLLYDILKNVDGLNMEDNFWQKPDKDYYYYNDKKGIQYIGDCSDINVINRIDKKYDLLLSSHVIEHLANPIKSLILHKKLLKKDGYILALIPNKNEFWDKTRKYTTMGHLINDYNEDVDESDMNHLIENLETSNYIENQNLIDMAKNNEKTRVMHHHCFNVNLVKKLFEYVGFETIYCFVHEKDKLQIIYLGKIKK